ncbi:hypothetical protein [Amycolatopsis nigrescens]|uniref:hypothetical protein n=1 Tax=Amycolatopsis nigrescens TaxID=381445 RepID=UPI00039E1BCF|nr:hypothetical protein [Amycolatopsis nigrescens]
MTQPSPRLNGTATDAVAALGALWSDSFDRWVAGEISASQLRCVLCEQAPCQCPPFGSAGYFALVDRRHRAGPGEAGDAGEGC